VKLFGHVPAGSLVEEVGAVVERGGRSEEKTMKTMTCRDLGGPCDVEHHGATADEIIKAQDRHLREAVRAGDETHIEARDAMKGRWRRPKKALDWYQGVKRAYAELPAR
jgi:predicted small metal-binding protein